MSLDPIAQMKELMVAAAGDADAFDEPESLQLMAHARAAGLITDDEWQDVLLWIRYAVQALGDTEAGEAEEGTVALPHDESAVDAEDEDSDDGDDEEYVDAIDADPRNADWICIVRARRISGYSLPGWAGLWLWQIGSGREDGLWWRQIGEVAATLGTQPFNAEY